MTPVHDICVPPLPWASLTSNCAEFGDGYCLCLYQALYSFTSSPLTRKRTLRPRLYPLSTSWWPRCHLKNSRLVTSSDRQALWSLIRSRLTKLQWFPECSVAYKRKGSSSELTHGNKEIPQWLRVCGEPCIGSCCYLKTYRKMHKERTETNTDHMTLLWISRV